MLHLPQSRHRLLTVPYSIQIKIGIFPTNFPNLDHSEVRTTKCARALSDKSQFGIWYPTRYLMMLPVFFLNAKSPLRILYNMNTEYELTI